MADDSLNQVEHEHISTSLQVEQLDTNLFRSVSLWLPVRARGVFGGQVISQAVASATKCVDPSYGLHVSICHLRDEALLTLVFIVSTRWVNPFESSPDTKHPLTVLFPLKCVSGTSYPLLCGPLKGREVVLDALCQSGPEG